MASNAKLLGLYRAQFERAKSDQRLVWWIQFAVAVSSLVGVFVPTPSATYLLALVALAGGVCSIFINHRATERKASAEAARRAHMLIEGLGTEISGKARSDLLGSLEVTEEEAKKWEDPNYYATNQSPGAQRLLEVIQESAFWSAELFKANAKKKWIQFSFGLLVSLGVLFGFPFLPDQKATVTAAQIVCIGLSFLITRDLVSRARSFSGASQAMEKIDVRLDAMRAPYVSTEDALLAFGDYNYILESAPTIESGLYKKDRDRLSRRWTERHEN